MTESFKWKSRLTTIIAGLITILSTITADQWAIFLPMKYRVYAPIIVAIIAFLAAQITEETRVTTAETLKVEELTNTNTPSGDDGDAPI